MGSFGERMQREREMRTWHGEDYGRIDDSLITITSAYYNEGRDSGAVAQNSRNAERNGAN